MRICVTKNDIDRARSGARCCPIACSLRRRGYPDVSVGPRMLFTAGKFAVLPETAQAFVNAYDNGHDVKPFSFTLPRLK